MNLLTKLLQALRLEYTDESTSTPKEKNIPEVNHDDLIKTITSKQDAKKTLLEAVEKAADDGEITLEEMKEIEELKANLEITNQELSDAKVKVFRRVVEKVLADNIVTDEEMDLLNNLQKGLEFNDSEMIRLLGDFQKVQLIYQRG